MLPTSKSGNRRRRINSTHLQSFPHHHRRATFAQRDMPRFTVGRGAPRGLGMPKIGNFSGTLISSQATSLGYIKKNIWFYFEPPIREKTFLNCLSSLLFIFIIIITSNPFAQFKQLGTWTFHIDSLASCQMTTVPIWKRPATVVDQNVITHRFQVFTVRE